MAVPVARQRRYAHPRQHLAQPRLDGRAHRVNVTVSAGVSMFPDHSDNPQDLWRLANQALLKAKRPPKNQVVFYRPEGTRGYGTQ